ncbi:MAG: aminoglycoside phosphotransferase family protein [Clostridiales bacterium]|nr:aminoglycoside phosphotransferase family protein [Clostridiales bacterium]
MTFDGTEILIGKGAQAQVLLYKGFAYKIYRKSYPVEWIAFEKKQQKEVNKAGLCSVRYYDTDDPHIIRMDYIDGGLLETAVRECAAGRPGDGIADVTDGFRMLSDAFKTVHKADIRGLDIPRFADTAAMGLTEEQGRKIIPVIERLSREKGECLCHLDIHFLNIMLPRDKSGMKIIDWMNARIAPAVFDYARTYVIFEEVSKEVLDLYTAAVLPDLKELGISDTDFADAAEVCSIVRAREKTT